MNPLAKGDTPEEALCQRCLLLRDQVCPLHPAGPDRENCLDFRPQVPEEYGSYLGQVITEVPKSNQAGLMELLVTHPLFTGRCPQCGREIAETEPPRTRWDCPACGWVDPT